jgi:hypothetical protein
MDDISFVLLRLVMVFILYCIPIIIFRLYKGPLVGKKPWLISSIYVIAVALIHFAIAAYSYASTGKSSFDPISVRSIFVWILIDHAILACGRKKVDPAPKESKQNQDSSEQKVVLRDSSSDMPSFSESVVMLSEGVDKIYGKESALLLKNTLRSLKSKISFFCGRVFMSYSAI